MKIVILDGHAVNPGDLSWESLAQFGEVTVYERTEETAVQARCAGAEILLTNKTPITAELLDACPTVRLICVLATGYNVVDCEAARQRGIPVCNVPSYGTDAVAQFTFALLLELCHRVGLHSDSVHKGDWCASEHFCYWKTPLIELAGKTMGIIGFGRIGRAVGKIAKAFGMQVLAYSRSRCPEGEAIGTYADLDTVLSQSDVISLHCPLTEQTAGIICKESINKMKPGVLLLNTARGPLVEEADLAQALRSGKIQGAAVDVISREPMLPANPLLGLENCIITPHIAWAPKESRQRIIDCTVRSIRAFLDGSPVNTVNM